MLRSARNAGRLCPNEGRTGPMSPRETVVALSLALLTMAGRAHAQTAGPAGETLPPGHPSVANGAAPSREGPDDGDEEDAPAQSAPRGQDRAHAGAVPGA